MIDLAAALKHQQQFGAEAGKQTGQGGQGFPVRAAAARIGQRAYFAQRGEQIAIALAQFFQQVQQVFAGLVRGAPGAGKSLAHAHRLAPAAGFGQQQFGDFSPAGQGQRVGVERRRGAALGTGPVQQARYAPQPGAQAVAGAAQARAQQSLGAGGQELALTAAKARAAEYRLPLFAALKQRGQQFDSRVPAVVQMQQQTLHIRAPLALRIAERAVQKLLYRLPVQGVGVVRDAQGAAESTGHGQLPGEVGTETVDGANGQSRGVVQQAPGGRRIALAHRLGQIPQPRLMRRRGPGAAGGGQGLQHPGAHLGRRLAREGNGDHLLGGFDARQQQQQALHEQPGFP